jgi:hypothetical protein
MPVQAKPSLILALLLTGSYLLLSTCGVNNQDEVSSREEIPAETTQSQLTADLQATEPAATPAGAHSESPSARPVSVPVQPVQKPQPATSPAPYSQASEPIPATATRPKPHPAPLTVGAGETIDVEFRQTLSSHTSQVGQPFQARVNKPVFVGEKLVIPAGATIHGRVIEAEPAKKIGGRARLALDFETLSLANGATYPIAAVFFQKGKSQTGKDAAIIGGATLGGAVLGKQVGGDTGTIIGAVAGGIGGAFAAKKTKGKPVEVPAGTEMILELTQPVTIDVLP